MEPETEHHALFVCPHARALRGKLRKHWRLPLENDLMNEGPEWLLLLLARLTREEGAGLALLFWRTWYVHNERVHKSKVIEMLASVTFLQHYATTLTLVRQRGAEVDGKGKGVVEVLGGSCRQPTMKERWRAPPTGWIKVNVNGAFDHISKRAGVGVVARDEWGKVVLSAWRVVFDAKLPEEIKMLACREGANLATEWVRAKVIIKTDCTVVANMLIKRESKRSELCFLAREVFRCCAELPDVVFQAVRRECNSAAHELAQLAKRTAHTAVWRWDVPQCIKQLVTQDCILIE
ncbi:hypothetical protein PR202_ga11630 [Eleusine coracana subsp. coracana]|uniref:RNase H type-1 domain-containing protein n=1 Tax=Eleusine coracana subsp. coracana TaxID=191504 RepID=A0AAV5C9T9_ELECO|nr:hypothetical protein PR202_ga11630 [Eleusine coracana subsp. coracana]